MKIYKNSNEPIYKQISAQLREKILIGELKEGECLPSIRGLAQDLKISVITTMKAYDELAAEGLVNAVAGKGYYVNAQNSEMLKEQHLRQLENALMIAIDSARIAGIDKNEVINILSALWTVE
ncbi:MAG: GntR family transcriptional regulator [Ruminococcus sp.]|nr:GntR family transcriptional regulator [Ruminococcus sp.]